MHTPTYTIDPHPRGGARLTGPRLPYPLWYEDEMDAAEFALRHLRETGGRLVFLGSRGYHIITEHMPVPEGNMRGGAHAQG